MSGPEAVPGEDTGPTAGDPAGGTGEDPPAEAGATGDVTGEWTADGAIPDGGAVVLFDGVCNLCSGVVRFVIPRDPEGNLRFASLQSAAADRLLADYDREAGFDSVVLVTEDGWYAKSDAILRMATYMKRPYPLAWGLRVIPGLLRDAVYDLVAASRYRVFGTKDQCMVPSDDVRSRFLEDPTGSE